MIVLTAGEAGEEVAPAKKKVVYSKRKPTVKKACCRG